MPPESQSPDSNGPMPPTSQDAMTADSGDNAAPSSHAGWTNDQYEDALRKARDDAKKIRLDAKRLAELEAKEAAAADAALSDKERHDKQKAEWAAEREALLLKIQEKATGPRIEREAEKLGISAKLALAITPRDQIVYDEQGDPTNIAEVLKATIEALEIATPSAQQSQQPAQRAAASQQPVPQTGATNPPRGSQLVGANGKVYDRNEIPKLNDPGLWKRGAN